MLNAINFLLFTVMVITVFGQTQTCPQNVNHPGLKSIVQESSTGTIIREYILNVPTGYDEEVASPLVLNLHGFGDCASDFSETVGSFYAFDELANQENILVAYPQGAYRPDKEDTYWEPGDNGEMDIFENDIYFFEQLILAISESHNVDLDRIYAIGYSNGGMMCYSLACNRGNLFAGIGIMSGTMLEENCQAQSAVPVITFHGIGDEVLPFDGNEYYQSVSDVISFWLDQNGIDANSLSSAELNDGKVIKDEYNADVDNSCIHLYTVNEEYDKPGDHVWFSEDIEGISPNRIIWNFFSDNCNPLSSINENLNSHWQITPNPVENQFVIESTSELGQVYKIFDTQGRLLLEGIINSKSITVDIASLKSNIYLLEIDGVVKKLIKI